MQPAAIASRQSVARAPDSIPRPTQVAFAEPALGADRWPPAADRARVRSRWPAHRVGAPLRGDAIRPYGHRGRRGRLESPLRRRGCWLGQADAGGTGRAGADIGTALRPLLEPAHPREPPAR